MPQIRRTPPAATPLVAALRPIVSHVIPLKSSVSDDNSNMKHQQEERPDTAYQCQPAFPQPGIESVLRKFFGAEI